MQKSIREGKGGRKRTAFCEPKDILPNMCSAKQYARTDNFPFFLSASLPACSSVRFLCVRVWTCLSVSDSVAVSRFCLLRGIPATATGCNWKEGMLHVAEFDRTDRTNVQFRERGKETKESFPIFNALSCQCQCTRKQASRGCS
mmetsp:Transcript_21954/g.43563  ORF Transcript_21954/g.43563 Transcript_21954/m.43563 type:complete len:144 (-) Transcript_21954:1911-2342(-)